MLSLYYIWEYIVYRFPYSIVPPQAVGGVPGLGLAANNGLAFSWPVEAGRERSWEVRGMQTHGSVPLERSSFTCPAFRRRLRNEIESQPTKIGCVNRR